MPDLIPSEATTAGAIRQSVDGTKRCPRCGSKLDGRNPYLPSYGRYECGSYERDDTATIECYRRQLAQAKERADELQRQIDEDDDKWTRYNDLYVEARGEIVDLQLHNAQLRRLLQQAEWANSNWFCNPDDLKDMPEWANHPRCPWCDAPKATGRHAPDCEVAAALSSSPENPYAAVVEAEREVIEAAKAWLASGRAEKAKNDAGQDDWYSAHADVCNRLMDAVDALNNLGGAGEVRGDETTVGGAHVAPSRDVGDVEYLPR